MSRQQLIWSLLILFFGNVPLSAVRHWGYDVSEFPNAFQEINLVQEKTVIYIQSGSKTYQQVNFALKPEAAGGNVLVQTAMCELMDISIIDKNTIAVTLESTTHMFKAEKFIFFRYAPGYGLWVSGKHFPNADCDLAFEAFRSFDVYPLMFTISDGANVSIKEMYPDRFIRRPFTLIYEDAVGQYSGHSRLPSEAYSASFNGTFEPTYSNEIWVYLSLVIPLIIGLIVGFCVIYSFVRCCWWSIYTWEKGKSDDKDSKNKKDKKSSGKSKNEKSKKDKSKMSNKETSKMSQKSSAVSQTADPSKPETGGVKSYSLAPGGGSADGNYENL
ncbi:unnamed protein product [Bursaphelenchus okinawaensis]|uniref:Uncharacterized protein n=1 Tax=Bursaphelenchus okinawaensis TaxID=465554 RepID=A0A811JQ33_9BILA|nr:unnamed protein product [Bursaphelenchus okinawaensis]CAG9077475.1 unnamed protein product [Bursaphelenchus okinawaensis]